MHHLICPACRSSMLGLEFWSSCLPAELLEVQLLELPNLSRGRVVDKHRVRVKARVFPNLSKRHLHGRLKSPLYRKVTKTCLPLQERLSAGVRSPLHDPLAVGRLSFSLARRCDRALLCSVRASCECCVYFFSFSIPPALETTGPPGPATHRTLRKSTPGQPCAHPSPCLAQPHKPCFLPCLQPRDHLPCVCVQAGFC